MQSVQLIHQLLTEIPARRLNANVSLKLTHMGLDFDPQLAYDQVNALVAAAASVQPRNFVRVDMEGAAYTQRTLNFVHELHRPSENCRCVAPLIQSYIHPSQLHLSTFLSLGTPI